MEGRVVLSLGSNVGDTGAILREAIEELGCVLADLRVSSLYVTKPQDFLDQADFRNIACSGEFAGTPRELLRIIHQIEDAHGRNRAREIQKGPRPLDIDIILFASLVVRDPDLVIPHERMKERQFVLIPLLELHPECADPVTGESLSSVLERLSDQGVEKAGNIYGN
jgi:2-amino-4-hydroxy-6-hydroxymethyldihydropteridine diphosphokinase